MARSHGVLKTSVWEPGSEFRALSPIAQWGYVMLLSQPQISNLGVLAYTPEKWARLAAGLTVPQVEAAIAELAAGRYVIVDQAAGELLIRTFVRHDKVWSQPKLVTNARRLIREVESDNIRACLTARHPWLATHAGRDEIELYEARQERGIDTPSGTPIERTIERGIPTPAVEGVSKGVSEGVSRARASRAPAGAGAGVSSSSRSKALQEPTPLDHLEPAAADLEPPREQAVRATTNALKDHDHESFDRIWPLANQLPQVLWQDVLDRFVKRTSNGSVQNHTGYLLKLLRLAAEGQRRRTALDHLPETGDLKARIEQEAASYATAKHPWHVVEPLLRRHLQRHGATTNTDDLMDAAGTAYATAAQGHETSKT